VKNAKGGLAPGETGGRRRRRFAKKNLEADEGGTAKRK